MAAEQVEEHTQQHDPEDDHSVHPRTAHAKRAALVPLMASTLSPVASPVCSPVSSPVVSPTSQQLRPSPFSIVPVTFPASSSFSSSSSSCSTCLSSSDPLSSLASLSSSPPAHPPPENKCACCTHTDMTVAKLDPGTTTGPISPSASFSPPATPLSQKKGIYSATTTTTTTSTTIKTSSSNNSSSATLMDESTTTTHHSETSSKTSSHPRRLGPKMNPIYKGLRAIVWALYFNLGASLISMTQVLSMPLALIAPRVYHWHISKTQGHFGAFLLRMNQLFAPSDIVLTGDESVRGIVKVYQGRNLKEAGEAYSGHGDDIILDMPERMVFIANHQIYSDWMYLWCFSYFAERHRALKIILRGDLTWIPVFGW
ncbi:hypothetical protein KVV02_007854 [Mortierella alpina]|uniref:Phospholipid/glycerol acyltransferase domain-containing protein n=1 Tax=Mortierella alpina TaxID=64518 RepID=A0A9P8CYS4_MORAP|nr:hypothetical protein KVV02_007854 [Mortierella alpina]